MKKITLTAVIFCIAVFLFCCKTYKDNVVSEKENVVENELSNYLNSAKGIMHNAPVPQGNTTNSGVVSTEKTPAIPLNLHTYKLPELSEKIIPQTDEPVLTKKQERKAKRAILKQKLKDGDGIGIAIGLLILYVALGILILVLLWYLIANSVNQSTNSSSNGGSGSNSNSGNSGNSGGSGSNSGCYVATMVYGSYDAPEVMVLRRFRDNTLSRSKAGRAFIRWYYSWSPGFVEKYHHLSWLHSIIKVVLNSLVKFLS